MRTSVTEAVVLREPLNGQFHALRLQRLLTPSDKLALCDLVERRLNTYKGVAELSAGAFYDTWAALLQLSMFTTHEYSTYTKMPHEMVAAWSEKREGPAPASRQQFLEQALELIRAKLERQVS